MIESKDETKKSRQNKSPDDSDRSSPGTKQQVVNVHMVRENHDIRESHLTTVVARVREPNNKC